MIAYERNRIMHFIRFTILIVCIFGGALGGMWMSQNFLGKSDEMAFVGALSGLVLGCKVLYEIFKKLDPEQYN